MNISIEKSFTFHAAHYLPYHKGKCNNLHGHTYQLDVRVTGGVVNGTDPDAGMIIDFGQLKEIVNTFVIDKYDHQNLNVHFENPTAELMAKKIYQMLANALPTGVFLSRVRLWETESACAIVEHNAS